MRPRARQHGSVLVVAMWVIIALTGLVLTLSFSMRTEAKAGANRLSQAQAEMAEHGAEQFLLSVVDQEIATPGTMANISFEARQIGDSYFWIVRPDWQNETGPSQAPLTYGLVDEGAKIDLNTATRAMLMNLPNMTEDVADSILDWRSDPTGAARAQGAKDDYYLSLPDPYHCKGAPYESIEELLLVKGITRDVLYGYDRNRNGVIDANESQGADNPALAFNAATEGAVGFAPFVTIYGVKAGTIPTSTSSSATSSSSSTTTKVDLNSADASRLATVLTQALADRTVAGRQPQNARPPGGGPYSTVFDWYYRVNPTYDQFNQAFLSLTANAAAAGGGSGGTSSGATAGAGTGRTGTGTTGTGSTGTSGAGTGSTGAGGTGTGSTGTGSGAGTAPRIGKVNINTAPPEVLRCLPQLDDNDVAAITSRRASVTSPTADDLMNVSWLVNIGLTRAKVLAIDDYVEGRSSVFSGDIVTVSGDGRAFRRYRVVIDGSKSPASIIWREDLTTAGWPLPPGIRDMIRAGEGPGVPVMTAGQGGSVK